MTCARDSPSSPALALACRSAPVRWVARVLDASSVEAFVQRERVVEDRGTEVRLSAAWLAARLRLITWGLAGKSSARGLALGPPLRALRSSKLSAGDAHGARPRGGRPVGRARTTLGAARVRRGSTSSKPGRRDGVRRPRQRRCSAASSRPPSWLRRGTRVASTYAPAAPRGGSVCWRRDVSPAPRPFCKSSPRRAARGAAHRPGASPPVAASRWSGRGARVGARTRSRPAAASSPRRRRSREAPAAGGPGCAEASRRGRGVADGAQFGGARRARRALHAADARQ